MRERRTLYFVLVAALVSIVLLSLVSAKSLGELANEGLSSLYDAVKPLLEVLIGDTSGTSTFIAKVLLALLIVAVLYGALSASNVTIFTANPWVLWVTAIVLGILGVRFLDASTVATIMLPNTVFGIVVSAGIPFVAYFILIRGFPVFPRRVAWVFFAVVFLALWNVRYSELGQLSWVYPLTALLALIMAGIEGIIQDYFFKSRIKRAASAGKAPALSALQTELNTIHTNYAAPGTGGTVYTGATAAGSGMTGDAAYRADVRDVKQRIKQLMRA